MKTVMITMFAMTISAIGTWGFLQKDSNTEAAAVEYEVLSQANMQELYLKIETLEMKLAAANQVLLEQSNAMASGAEDTGNDAAYAFYPEQESRVSNQNNKPFSPDDPRSKLTKVQIVNPTPEQNENYEVMKANLDDPNFLYGLSLQEFASTHEVSTLPEPMKLALLQKAVKQYHLGNISQETFLGLDVNQ